MVRILNSSQSNEKLSSFEVVIHIGAPKAGTSAIQKFCLLNRKKLLESGFYYPKHGLDENGISGGHTDIGGALLNGDFNTAENIFRTYLKKAKSKNKVLLISAESLYLAHEEVFELVKDLRVLIISYVRDPIEALLSNYNQGVKRHYRSISLDVFLKRQLNNINDVVSGLSVLKWKEQFKNFLLLPFDRKIFPGGGIESHFLATLGISSSELSLFDKPTGDVNSSYCLAAMESKRLCNLILDSSSGSLAARLDLIFQKYSDLSSFKRFSPAELMGVDVYELYVDAFYESNQILLDSLSCNATVEFLKPIQKTRGVLKVNCVFSQLFDVMSFLKAEDHDIFSQLQKLYHLSHRPMTHPDWITLCHLLDLPINHAKDFTFRLGPREMSILTDDASKPFDALMVLASALERNGNFSQARQILKRCLLMRPKAKRVLAALERLSDDQPTHI